jgi:hypothetical protein
LATAKLTGRSSAKGRKSGKPIIKISGFKEMPETIAKIKKLSKLYPFAMAAALYEEALAIFAESQEEVPVDKGGLRRSGIVFMREISQNWTAIVGYGVAYALKIHQDVASDQKRIDRAELALSNPKHKPKGAQHGKSKYLEDPFNRALPGLSGRLIIRTRKHAKAGRTSKSGLKTVRGRAKGK